MHLAQLRARNFRLFEGLSLRPHRQLNLILGANAAGKTTLLESIFCLGRGRSFRGNSPSELAGQNERRWAVTGVVEEENDRPPASVLVQWSDAGTELRLARATATTAELVRALPVQILEPATHRLLHDGPSYRRSYLDWGVFHVEQAFYPAWRRYQRALRQRNQALRSRAEPRMIAAWDPELAGAAAEIDQYRRDHLSRLHHRFGELVSRFLGIADWSLELQPGWGGGRTLIENLHEHLGRDRRTGVTSVGPHRAELRIRLDRHQVRNRLSRGQLKLLLAALLLAQCEEIGRHGGRQPILLMDDFAAELAEAFQKSLLITLAQYPGQVFITAFEAAGPLRESGDAATFHVEQGRLRVT